MNQAHASNHLEEEDKSDRFGQVCALDQRATRALVRWCDEVHRAALSPFAASQQVARRLGARPADGLTEVGFWAPSAAHQGATVWLELLTPLQPVDLNAPEQRLQLDRQLIPLARSGEFYWGAVEGLTAGSRLKLGTLYQARWQDRQGGWHTEPDLLAASIPFGSFAPAELYDLPSLHRTREDRDHFAALAASARDEAVPRVPAPGNILQLHVPTATEDGTLAGLARLYRFSPPSSSSASRSAPRSPATRATTPCSCCRWSR